MLARKYRFHGLGSLRPVYRHGRTVRSQNLAVRFSENHKRSAFRCAVVVSKKVSKSAVKRNRIRRRVYAVIVQLAPRLKTYDIVITIFSDKLLETPASTLTDDVSVLLERAGLLNK